MSTENVKPTGPREDQEKQKPQTSPTAQPQTDQDTDRDTEDEEDDDETLYDLGDGSDGGGDADGAD